VDPCRRASQLESRGHLGKDRLLISSAGALRARTSAISAWLNQLGSSPDHQILSLPLSAAGPPVEFKAAYYEQENGQAMAA